MSKTHLTFTIDLELEKFDKSTVVLSQDSVDNIQKTILHAVNGAVSNGLLTSSDTVDDIPVTAKIVGIIQN